MYCLDGKATLFENCPRRVNSFNSSPVQPRELGRKLDLLQISRRYIIVFFIIQFFASISGALNFWLSVYLIFCSFWLIESFFVNWFNLKTFVERGYCIFKTNSSRCFFIRWRGFLFFAAYVICKKNYSFSRVVFFSEQNKELFLFKNKWQQ